MPDISAILSVPDDGMLDFSKFEPVAMREADVDENGNIFAISF